MTVEQLAAAYIAKFGEEPVVLWTDAEADLREGMEKALRTGKPWDRSSQEEGVRS